MKEHFPELTFEVQDNGLVLISQYQNLERVAIDVHPQQLAHIGRALFGGRSAKDALVADLQRKVSVLTDRIGDLVTDKYIRSQITDRCGDWEAILAHWDHIYDLAVEFDGGLPTKAQLDADEAAGKTLIPAVLPSPMA